MIVSILVGNRLVPFRLDWVHERWHSLEELEESDFPLIADVEGKRYELYSDGHFGEEELDGPPRSARGQAS
jgi:hypothetical protein